MAHYFLYSLLINIIVTGVDEIDFSLRKRRRLIWLVVLTICFALMLLQTLDRLNYYLVSNYLVC